MPISEHFHIYCVDTSANICVILAPKVCNCEDNIKVNLKEILCENMVWFHVTNVSNIVLYRDILF